MTDFTLRVVVPGAPVPKGRPKFGRGRVYTPAKTKGYEALVAIKAKEAMKGRLPATGALSVTITAYLPAPKAAAKQLDRPHVSRPDLDNLIKAALDGCNGIAFADDSQIYNLTAHKEYSDDPRLEIFMLGWGSGIPRLARAA